MYISHIQHYYLQQYVLINASIIQVHKMTHLASFPDENFIFYCNIELMCVSYLKKNFMITDTSAWVHEPNKDNITMSATWSLCYSLTLVQDLYM